VIPKITRGGNTRGLLLYLIGKGRREEHVAPRLVAGSAEAMMIAGGRVLQGGARDAAQLARFLDEPRETFGTQVRIAERDQNGKVVGSRDAHVWHTSLSLHPDEPALSDERWGEIAERFISEMGFAGETARAQCRWVAVRHGESTGGSDHVHLVVGLVAEDGSKANVHFERKRAQQAARLLEREFGLRELESRGRGAGSRGLEPGEIAADHRRGVGVGERGEHAERSSRQRLERVVRACAGASRTEAEFVARLREQGIHARARYGTGGTTTVVGYSVRLAGPSEGRARTVWYGGGRLARDLSLPALRRGWGQEHGERQRAVAEWRSESAGGRSLPERQAELQERGLVWHRRTMEIERVRLGLRAAGTDPAACAHAAREGAAVLAAWSIDLEGEQPGALARASRHLARSAELSASTSAPPARRASSRASGLALFMLAAGRPDSAVGWLLVCRELGLLAGEIGRVHRACGELQRAHEIETELHGELEQIRARLNAGRPDPGPVELDTETEAARRAREPLGPATREAPERPVDVDDVEAVRRLIDPTRRRRPRQR
jgi:hypothetical protein